MLVRPDKFRIKDALTRTNQSRASNRDPPRRRSHKGERARPKPLPPHRRPLREEKAARPGGHQRYRTQVVQNCGKVPAGRTSGRLLGGGGPRRRTFYLSAPSVGCRRVHVRVCPRAAFHMNRTAHQSALAQWMRSSTYSTSCSSERRAGVSGSPASAASAASPSSRASCLDLRAHAVRASSAGAPWASACSARQVGCAARLARWLAAGRPASCSEQEGVTGAPPGNPATLPAHKHHASARTSRCRRRPAPA